MALDNDDSAYRALPGTGRTVLVHISVSVPESDTRDAEQIGKALLEAIDVGSDNDSVWNLWASLVLAADA